MTEAKAVAFRATADRRETLANLRQAFRDAGDDSPLLDVPADVVRPFAGLGYGYLLVDTLFDARTTTACSTPRAFWADVSAAVQALANPDTGGTSTAHLRAAAEKLRPPASR